MRLHDLNLEPAIGQVYPVAASGGGKIIAAWESHQAEALNRIVHTAMVFAHRSTQITFGTGEANGPQWREPRWGTAALAYAIQNGGTWHLFGPPRPFRHHHFGGQREPKCPFPRSGSGRKRRSYFLA